MATVTPQNLDFFGALNNTVKNIFQSAVEMKKNKFLMDNEVEETKLKKIKSEYDYWDKTTTDQSINYYKQAKQLYENGVIDAQMFSNFSDPLKIKKQIISDVDAIEEQYQKMIGQKVKTDRSKELVEFDPDVLEKAGLNNYSELGTMQADLYNKAKYKASILQKLKKGEEVTSEMIMQARKVGVIPDNETAIRLIGKIADKEPITIADFYNTSKVGEEINLNKDYSTANKNEVMQLQTKLNELGANIKVDGIFGDKTAFALSDYMENTQKKYISQKQIPLTKSKLLISGMEKADQTQKEINKQLASIASLPDTDDKINKLSAIYATTENTNIQKRIETLINNTRKSIDNQTKKSTDTVPEDVSTKANDISTSNLSPNEKITKLSSLKSKYPNNTAVGKYLSSIISDVKSVKPTGKKDETTNIFKTKETPFGEYIDTDISDNDLKKDWKNIVNTKDTKKQFDMLEEHIKRESKEWWIQKDDDDINILKTILLNFEKEYGYKISDEVRTIIGIKPELTQTQPKADNFNNNSNKTNKPTIKIKVTKNKQITRG